MADDTERLAALGLDDENCAQIARALGFVPDSAVEGWYQFQIRTVLNAAERAREQARTAAFQEYGRHLEFHYAGPDENVPPVLHADWCPLCRAEKAEAALIGAAQLGRRELAGRIGDALAAIDAELDR